MTVARRLERAAYQVGGMMLLGFLWWLVTATERVDRFVLPGPGAVWDALVSGWTDGQLADHTWTTLRAFLLVMVFSVVLGIVLGTVPGLRPAVHRSVEPLIGLLLSLPILTYFAVLVVVVGYGFWSTFALGLVAATPSVIVSTVTALQEIDPAIISVGRVYCRTALSRFGRVILPAALPTMSSGIRIAAGRALVGVIVGEMFMSSNGLGAQILSSSAFFDIPAYYAVVVTLAVMSYAITVVFGLLESRVTAGHS